MSNRPGQDEAGGAPREGGGVEVAGLVERFRSGDERAFDGLVEHFQGRMFNLAYRMTGDWGMAEELAQEAFVRAYRSMGKFRGQSSFGTWLYAITVNTCRQRLRRVRRRGRFEAYSLDAPLALGDGQVERQAASGEAGPDEIAGRREDRARVERAIAGLSPGFAAVIVMRDLQGMEYEEIAEALGCSLGTVKSRLFRARGHVRVALEDTGGRHL